MMVTPTMVGTVTITGQTTTKIGSGKCSHVVTHAKLIDTGLKIGHSLSKLTEQPGLILVLIVMDIKAIHAWWLAFNKQTSYLTENAKCYRGSWRLVTQQTVALSTRLAANRTSN